MNVRLRKNLVWYSGLVFQENFCVNHYEADIDLMTVTSDHNEQNIAYERMKSWVYQVLNDSILISENDPSLPRFQATGARIIILPEPPVDQILGIMLYLKLNSIMQNRMVVTDVTVKSSQGDDMCYLHSVGESFGENLVNDGWWSDPRPTWTDARPRGKEKVVALDRFPEWKDYGLEWDNGDAKGQNVVFAKFNKNENQ